MSRTPGDYAPVIRYGVAAAVVFGAVLTRLALVPALGAHSPYLPFTLAVLIAARFGGVRPGLAATALSALSITWFFLDPLHSFQITDPAAIGALALFIVVACLISFVAGRLRNSLLSSIRTERTLQEQARLINLSHDAIVTLDRTRQITGWNAGAQEMYGWAAAEAIGKTLHQFLPAGNPIATSEIDDILRRDGQWEGELAHTARDGRRLFVYSRQVLVRDERNEPIGILEIDQDITERKRTEQALYENESRMRLAQQVERKLMEEELRRSEEKLRVALAAAKMGIWDWNVVSGELVWSESCKALFGLSPDTAVTYKLFLQAIHPEDRDRIDGVVQSALSRGTSYDVEMRVPWPDGTERWVASIGHVFFNPAGQPIRMAGVARDITRRKENERAVLEAAKQRKLALEAARMGAWECDLDNGRVHWDEQCSKIFGGQASGWIERQQVMEQLHPDDRVKSEEVLRRAIAGEDGGAYHRECRVIWPDGTWHWVASHGQVFFEGDGAQRRPARLVGVSMETTARREAEERLSRTQKLESIGVLAGGVAHDFNNLLTVIMGSASAALEECTSCEHSKSILSASQRAAYLTKQLLAYAGKGEVVTKVFDLSELIDEAGRLLSASIPKRVELNFKLAQDLPCIEGDPGRVEQVLMNLVINAGEAIPAKSDGRVEVSTSRFALTPEMVGKHTNGYDVAAGSYVCLEVRDNGSGMDEAVASRIFEPFFSTKFTGRGLGLAAVHGIVRSSKGFIHLQSVAGSGSTFRVCFPISTKERPAKTAEAPRQQLRGSSTVLVVDDEAMVRKLASMILRRRGYEVLEAGDGKDALQVLATSSSLPALTLLDLAMPVMGGEELVPILNKNYPDLKIVITSGYPEEEARKAFASGTFAGFLQKPYTVAALSEKIADVLGSPGSGRNQRLVEFPMIG
jgi:PAS domain S-box-containing protein